MRAVWYVAGSRSVKGWEVVPILEAGAIFSCSPSAPSDWSTLFVTVRLVALLLVSRDRSGQARARLCGLGGPERLAEIIAFLKGL